MPLLLPAGERAAIHADLGFVAVRELRDHLVDVGDLGRLEDIGIGGIVAHAGDVGLDRGREELDVLRQVADALAELARIPVAQVHQSSRTVPAVGLIDPTSMRAKRRLAAAGGADDRQRVCPAPRLKLMPLRMTFLFGGGT